MICKSIIFWNTLFALVPFLLAAFFFALASALHLRPLHLAHQSITARGASRQRPRTLESAEGRRDALRLAPGAVLRGVAIGQGHRWASAPGGHAGGISGRPNGSMLHTTRLML